MRAYGRFNAMEAPTTINADLKIKMWNKLKFRPRLDIKKYIKRKIVKIIEKN